MGLVVLGKAKKKRGGHENWSPEKSEEEQLPLTGAYKILRNDVKERKKTDIFNTAC